MERNLYELLEEFESNKINEATIKHGRFGDAAIIKTYMKGFEITVESKVTMSPHFFLDDFKRQLDRPINQLAKVLKFAFDPKVNKKVSYGSKPYAAIDGGQLITGATATVKYRTTNQKENALKFIKNSPDFDREGLELNVIER